jgi:hypothetical protein
MAFSFFMQSFKVIFSLYSVDFVTHSSSSSMELANSWNRVASDSSNLPRPLVGTPLGMVIAVTSFASFCLELSA